MTDQRFLFWLLSCGDLVALCHTDRFLGSVVLLLPPAAEGDVTISFVNALAAVQNARYKVMIGPNRSSQSQLVSAVGAGASRTGGRSTTRPNRIDGCPEEEEEGQGFGGGECPDARFEKCWSLPRSRVNSQNQGVPLLTRLYPRQWP